MAFRTGSDTPPDNTLSDGDQQHRRVSALTSGRTNRYLIGLPSGPGQAFQEPVDFPLGPLRMSDRVRDLMFHESIPELEN